MNCSTFIKRLDDYIDNNITNDLKIAMDRHMEKCESCKNAYNEEIEIKEMFKKTFVIDGIKFSSSRSEIMKNIDKNRYSKKKSNKILFYFKKNRLKYVSIAAVLVLSIISVPNFINRYIKIDSTNQEKSYNITFTDDSKMDKSKEIQDIDMSSLNKKQEKKDLGLYDSNKINEESDKGGNDANMSLFGNESQDNETQSQGIAMSNLKEVYIPNFEKKILEKSVKTQFSTPWEQSPDNLKSAAIEGLGEFGAEEGIGKVYIKNNIDNSIISYELSNNEIQYSPKIVEWWDNTHIMIIVGYGYGTIDVGGNVYILDINTGSVSTVYVAEDQKEKVIDVKKEGENLKLKFRVYNDDMLNEYHIEEGTVDLYKINAPNSIKIVSKDGKTRIGKVNPR